MERNTAEVDLEDKPYLDKYNASSVLGKPPFWIEFEFVCFNEDYAGWESEELLRRFDLYFELRKVEGLVPYICDYAYVNPAQVAVMVIVNDLWDEEALVDRVEELAGKYNVDIDLLHTLGHREVIGQLKDPEVLRMDSTYTNDYVLQLIQTAKLNFNDYLGRIDRVWEDADWKHLGGLGNCGVFAVALNKMLGNRGEYICVSCDPEYFDHVAMRYGGKIYHHLGETTEDEMMSEYGWDEDDPDIEYELLTLPTDPDIEHAIMRGTDHEIEIDMMIALFMRSKSFIDREGMPTPFLKGAREIVDVVSSLRVSRIDEIYGSAGNCGVFAIALNRATGNNGGYLVLADREDDDFIYHILFAYENELYDWDGSKTKEDILDEFGLKEKDAVFRYLGPDSEDDVFNSCRPTYKVEQLIEYLREESQIILTR